MENDYKFLYDEEGKKTAFFHKFLTLDTDGDLPVKQIADVSLNIKTETDPFEAGEVRFVFDCSNLKEYKELKSQSFFRSLFEEFNYAEHMDAAIPKAFLDETIFRDIPEDKRGDYNIALASFGEPVPPKMKVKVNLIVTAVPKT